MIVKAYRADWDGTLQPYALYVPRDYKPGRPGGWPLIVALHGAFSDHRHNLRRVFGLDNRPRENDAEASRNELPLPDVPGAGRVAVRARRADGLRRPGRRRRHARASRTCGAPTTSIPDRISLTGLSMGGGGTWQIGLRHPELFAALAPVCAVADYRRMVPPADARALRSRRARPRSRRRRWPPTPRACRCSSFTATRTRPCRSGDSRKMVERFRAARLAGQERPLHRVPGRRVTAPGSRRTRTRRCCARWPASSAIRPRPRCRRRRRRRACTAIPGLFGKSVPAAGAAPLRLRHARRARRGRGGARARERAGRLGADGRRALHGQGRRRRDRRRPRAVLAGAGRGGAAQRAGRPTRRCPTRACSAIAPSASLAPERPVGRAAARWCWAR